MSTSTEQPPAAKEEQEKKKEQSGGDDGQKPKTENEEGGRTTTAEAAASPENKESAEPEPEAGAGQKVRKRRLGVDPSLIISEERSKRRRTPTPEPGQDEKNGVLDPKDPERAYMLGMQIYQKIMDSMDSDGESMSLPFVKLPNKRSFPDYYETIKHPMSLEIVHARLEKKEYQTLKEVTADLGQMFTNAKRYNVKESLLFQYAKKLHKMTRTFYTSITNPNASAQEHDSDAEGEPAPASAAAAAAAVAATVRDATVRATESVEAPDVEMGDAAGPSNASADGGESASGGLGGRASQAGKKRGSYMKDGPTVYKLVKPVLKSIKEAKSRDGTGREIAGIFMDLPDRRDLPDYYKTIKQPIALREIEDRMMARSYQTWEQFFEDVELMCSNAMEYNEDDSEVFQDAKQIQDILAWHRAEVKERLAAPQVGKFRVKPTTITPVRIGQMPGAGRRGSSSVEPPSSHYRPSPAPAYYPQSSSTPGSSAYPQHPAANNSTPAPYLPALPQGVVTEEVVASLDRYPPYEQQAWVSSLPPLAQQVYRQMAAAHDARKRGLPLPPPAPTPSSALPSPAHAHPLADFPSSGRPNGVPSFPDRQAPPTPTIRYLDFVFHAASPAPSSSVRQALRSRNFKGVVAHAVVLGSDTSEIELTAYVDGGGTSDDDSAVLPEVSLRVNGNPGSLAKFVYEQGEGRGGGGGKEKQPRGMRWTVSVPSQRVETKVEVVATKPGVMAETTTVFISRQF